MRNFFQGACASCLKLFLFSTGNSCYLKCTQLPEGLFKTTEGIYASPLLEGVHFLGILELLDLCKAIVDCLNLWRAPVTEQPFPLDIQTLFSRPVSLCCCLCRFISVLPLPVLGKRTLSAPGNGSDKSSTKLLTTECLALVYFSCLIFWTAALTLHVGRVTLGT